MAEGNKTKRALEKRIRDFRKRTGGDYSAVWIAPETFWSLPPDLIGRAMGEGLAHNRPPVLTILRVPIRVLQVLDPA